MKFLENIDKFAETERIAVKCLEEELTYRELKNYSNKIGDYLLNEFKDNRTPIIIYGNKDNYIIPIMVGALKSGRAYVPVDVTFPQKRVNQIIEEINPKIIFNFTDKNLSLDNIKEIKKTDIINILNSEIEPKVSPKTWVKESDNCYILFTSGSTGKPKGVQINRKNIESFTNWFTKKLDFDESNKVILNQISYSFDVSVIPIYMGLANGKTLFTLNKDTLEDLGTLFRELLRSNIDYWVSTPALAEICCKFDDFNDNNIKNISTFVFAGEVLNKNLVNELKEKFTHSKIINGYGPTEATVLISAINITEDIMKEDKIPIGYPITSCTLRIIDTEGNEVKDGEKGELIVIGDSVSEGYLNNPEMTKKVFFKSENNRQAYRTGDLVYYKNGIIYYCGRKDFQIKLNGFRIEIEDIENNLRKVSNINNAVVLPVYNEEGKISHLTAFIVLNKENDLSNLKKATLIKNELKELIPSYMIPRNIKILKEFKLNTNGKIDRKALMEDIK